MASNTLYILLCSGEHEKVQMAAMMASVAAVSERPVEVFISMNALIAFAKGASRRPSAITAASFPSCSRRRRRPIP